MLRKANVTTSRPRRIARDTIPNPMGGIDSSRWASSAACSTACTCASFDVGCGPLASHPLWHASMRARSGSDLPVAAHDPLRGRELGETHGSPRVHLLRRDPDLRAQPELPTI